MWAWAIWPWAAGEAPPTGNDTIANVVITVLGTVVVAALGVIAEAFRRSRNDQRDAAVTAAENTNSRPTNERVAVLERRQDDTDDELDIIDRQLDGTGRRIERHQERLEQIEEWLDRNDPGWRSD